MSQISTVQLKDIREAQRLDAEYFKPEYLDVIESIHAIGCEKLGNLVEKIDVGFVGKMTDQYADSGVLLLQTKNIDEFVLDLSQMTFIRESFHRKLRKTQIHYKDILIARSGSFGKTSIYLEQDQCNSADIIVIRTGQNLNPFFLVAFLNSQLGVEQLLRFASGGLQGHVNLTILENLKIPLLSAYFQNKIEGLVLDAHQKQSQSKQLYQEAEQLLLQELGLIGFAVDHSLTFEATRQEIEHAGRYDAEYFQPKYEATIEHIKRYAGGWEALGNMVSWKKGVEVGADAYTETGKDFLRVADVSVTGIEPSDKKFSEKLFQELYDEYAPRAGEILFTKDGTIGISYLVNEDMEAVVSGAFLRLRLKEWYQTFEKECLTLLLNSIVCRLQIEQLSGGALIAHLKPSDFEKLRIPLIRERVQKEVAEKVTESRKLREESRELLEKAKRMVEEEIEQRAKTA